MSGGPYRRGKAPARVCLPLIQWPEADRRRWLIACDASDLLNDDAGTRSGHAASVMRRPPRATGGG